MSLKKQKWMRKGTRVLALLQEGTITKTRHYVLDRQQFVYLIHVTLDGTSEVRKYHPQDVEKL
jgi:hypothetical protein